MKIRLVAMAFAWVALVWPQAATLAERPYLQNVREDRAVLLWTTVQTPGTGTVEFGEPAGATRTVRATVRALGPEETGLETVIYQHKAELRDLAASRRYRYRVLLNGADVLPLLAPDELAFSTAAPGEFVFLVFGDSGDGGRPQHDLADQMAREHPALVLHTGDLAYQEGTFQQFEDFYLRAYWPLMRRVPFFPAPGNHDYVFRNGAAFVALHDVPAANVPERDRGRYYSFDWGNVHFVALDTNTPFREWLSGQGDMLRWLDRDLGETRQEFRVVYFHHPPFPTANYRDDAYCREVAAAITGTLEHHGVHLVFNGHEHLYQRTKAHRGVFRDLIGTRYITTGGAGSTVYPPVTRDFLDAGFGASHYVRVHAGPHQLRVEAVGVNSEVLDEFTVTAAPRLEAAGVREAATGSVGLAPGSLASIYGSDLAAGDASGNGFPLPRTLGGVAVKMDGQAAPLLFVSRNQVNFQIPYAAETGTHELAMETAAGLTKTTFTLRAAAPAIFGAGQQAAIIHGDGLVVTEKQPASPGEVLAIFLTGLGRPLAAVADGMPAPSSPPVQTAAARVLVAGLECEVTFAGLAPGFAGLNQINFRVAAGVGPGLATVQVLTAGAASEAALMAVR